MDRMRPRNPIIAGIYSVHLPIIEKSVHAFLRIGEISSLGQSSCAVRFSHTSNRETTGL